MEGYLLLAQELDVAMSSYSESGWDVDILYTAPPVQKTQGKLRVVRCKKVSAGKIMLTVAREQDVNIKPPQR